MSCCFGRDNAKNVERWCFGESFIIARPNK